MLGSVLFLLSQVKPRHLDRGSFQSSYAVHGGHKSCDIMNSFNYVVVALLWSSGGFILTDQPPLWGPKATSMVTSGGDTLCRFAL